MIDVCGCGGRLKIVSISRDERIRRRLGGAWIARCSRCIAEVQVKPDAWRRFVRQRKQQKQKDQLSLFQC